MANYEEARVKVKIKTGTTLRITKKNFQDEELPCELSITAKQKTKIRNAFASNMLTDIKLSKALLSKLIQLGGFLGALLSKLAGLLMKVGASLTEIFLASLATMPSASAIDDNIQRKVPGWGTGVVGAAKGITLVILSSNEDMEDIIRIIKSLEDSILLIDVVKQ